MHFLLFYVYMYKTFYICKNVDHIHKLLGNAYYSYLEMQRRTKRKLAKKLEGPTLIKEDGCPACPKVC